MVEPLILHGWTAHKVAVRYDVLQMRHHIRQPASVARSNQIIAQLDVVISQLSPSEFLACVDIVHQRIFSRAVWDGVACEDDEFTNMCRYIQKVEVFMTLRHTIRVGNIGLIRRMIDRLCAWFYGAEQLNYGREMLYLQWLLTDRTSTPELQHAILASSLVNLSGRLNGFKAIDLALEHVNCTYAVDMKMHKNSTHDFTKTLDRLALASFRISRCVP